eukprot:TRINITY_DN89282_c0_g1_i1.p3 TRINITY_DN89282_c0_g1~~TRINITY_DN89282_c0_g1_i1.p3  ORF type:complete len:113 (+),score=30.00 TRINITY_DN89282_c0_g1_i1:38-376(+)
MKSLAIPLVLLLLYPFQSGAEEAAGKKEVTDAERNEFTQDFLDFDLNKDNLIDAQEVRAQFKGELDQKELHQFFLDVDKDLSGTITLEEYIDYAVNLMAAGGSDEKAAPKTE